MSPEPVPSPSAEMTMPTERTFAVVYRDKHSASHKTLGTQDPIPQGAATLFTIFMTESELRKWMANGYKLPLNATIEEMARVLGNNDRTLLGIVIEPAPDPAKVTQHGEVHAQAH